MKKILPLLIVLVLAIVNSAHADFDGRLEKESVIQQLGNLIPAGDKKDDHRIEKAIKHVEKSLDEDLWHNGFSVTIKGGKVFDEDNKAIHELMKVKHSDVQKLINSLIDIDFTLADVALQKANELASSAECNDDRNVLPASSEKGKNKKGETYGIVNNCEKAWRKIEKSEREFKEADKELNTGKYDKVIKHYKQAWKHAREALVLISGNEDADGDGVPDFTDNCPDLANPLQEDCNRDFTGDVCDAINPEADDSVCDGVDQNCNGVPDDGYVPTATSCGQGVCAATGQNLCMDGSVMDNCSPGIPSPEICDELDNDCNGQVDEGFDPDGDGICDAFDNLSPVVHYKFDSEDGAVIADHGSARADATLVGDWDSIPDEEGVPDEAYALAGSDTYVDVDAVGLAEINALLHDGAKQNKEITIAMNCRIGLSSVPVAHLLEISGGGNKIIRITSLAGGIIVLQMNLDGDGDDVQIATWRLIPAQWYHVALTYSEHTAKLYINGNAVGLGYNEDAPVFDFTTLKILSGNADLAVSDFKIYDRSLKHRHVKALWNKMHAHFTLDRKHTVDTTVFTDRTYGLASQYSGSFYSPEVTQFPARFAMETYRDNDGAIEFDGYNYIKLDPNLSTGLSNDTFSIAAWIKPAGLQGGGVIAAKTGEDQAKLISLTRGWKLWQEGSSIKFKVYSIDGAAQCEYQNFNENVWSKNHRGWMHVVATWDRFSGRAKLYVNGKSVATAVNYNPMTSTDNPVLIGAQYDEDNNPNNYWSGVIDDLQFFNKALKLGPLSLTYLQTENPGVRQLFEDGYLVRGYTDCAFPYEDCNPAADQVLRQYQFIYENPEPANPANPSPVEQGSLETGDTDDYDYVLDGGSSHIQGSQWFLPPYDQWFVYSRSNHNSYNNTNGPKDRIFGFVDWNTKSVDQFEYVFNTSAVSPPPDGELDHGGGIQAIGKYFIVPVDSNGGSTKTSTFYTAMYDIEDFLINVGEDKYRYEFGNKVAPVHNVLGTVDKFYANGNPKYDADVLGAIVKDSTNRYLWLDALYEEGQVLLQERTSVFRFNISNENFDISEQKSIAPRERQFDFITELDIDTNETCWQVEDDTEPCAKGNWNSGALIAQTDGRIYLLLTAAFNQINLLEVKIDKVTSKVEMNQLWDKVHLKMPAFSGLTLKAGAGARITRNGRLELFTTSLGDGIHNDYVNWGRWESTWDY